MRRTQMFCLSAALLGSLAGSVCAQELRNEGPVPTTALVRVDSRNNVQLDPSALRLQVNGRDTPITSVQRVEPAAAQVAILIDDGLRGSFSLQLRDLQKFINQLPAGTKVLVGYMQNGSVRSSGHFSADHQEISSKLRMPMSSAGISASPYFCLSDFVKHWPSRDPGARFVLMVTNGVDPYNGSTSPMNQDSPYVMAAQNDAQRAGVPVYSIYYGNAGFHGGRGSFSGQSYLAQVAEATGGQLFNQGPITPVSLAPYLANFRRAIEESYTISFMASANHERGNTLDRIKVRTSQGGVNLRAPQAVHPGTTEAVAQR